MNKKADVGVGIILLVLIVLIFLSLWSFSGNRECNSNSGCSENQYCGSDFACHNIPIIEKTVVQKSYTMPILIICLTIIALAIIWRWSDLFGKKDTPQKTSTQEPEETEPFYSQQFQYTAK